MAHGLNSVVINKRSGVIKSEGKSGGIGSRRIFAPQFKLQVLDSYRNDADCKGNQRATARKYGIHRRQIQKWLQVEQTLRNSVLKMKQTNGVISSQSQQVKVDPEVNKKCVPDVALSKYRQQDDTSPVVQHQWSGDVVQQVMPSTEQRVPYIHIPTTAVYTQVPSVDDINTRTLHTNKQTILAPVCTSPADSVHRVPSSNVSPLAPPPPTSYSLEEQQNNNTLSDTHINTTESALDFTTHALSHHQEYNISKRELLHTDYNYEETYMYETHLSAAPPCCPIDLSIKKSPCCPCSPIQLTPVLYTSPPTVPVQTCEIPSYSLTNPVYQHIQHTSPYYTNTPVELDHLRKDSEYKIWDLSIKKDNLKRKFCDTPPGIDSADSQVPAKKPVKLFKPYLDDDDYCSSSSNNSTDSRIKNEHISFHYDYSHHPHSIYLNNNNNDISKNIIESYPYYYHPNHCINSYDYVTNGHGYETDNYLKSNIFNNNNNNNNNNSSISNNNINASLSLDKDLKTASPIKQRQSYSLNFKLSAIECYYNDEICKGNQRAVASKYKIHRRQVQKWLKQEQELRNRIQCCNQSSEIYVN